jgi:putative zinc finger/helix-turn-helix YgiT family protein
VLDYPAEMEHDGRAYSLTIPALDVLRCESCGTRVLTDEAHQAIVTALRTAAGLLAPEEIRRRRESLGLTQKQLAACLKVADSTVSRWETGAQIQQRAMDLLLRAFFEVPQLRQYCADLAGVTQATQGLPVERQDADTSEATVIQSQSAYDLSPMHRIMFKFGAVALPRKKTLGSL